MKPIITFLLSLMLIICNQCFSRKSENTLSECNNNVPDDSLVIHKTLVGVDSVAVIYSAIDAYHYIFRYSQNQLQIHRSSNSDPFHQCLSDSHIIDEFLDYIDIFFVTQSETIETTRVTGDCIVTDYPNLLFKLFFENKLVQKQSIQYGEEGYDIEYNPKFVAFYKFLDNLVPTSKDQI
ncbi:MAG: hypothetical protein IJ714_00925 [Bacteroidales bacterium]|nr:hypothetical protein [Bacteroidales bacterium]